ncbi:hypothetical protein C4588_02070 [Candidatus Parcubacteria bacterium]|nr:MAG: hypothetical protein C4588_02070 [Candidatus Parcubacteria bacterium]
MCVIIFKPYGSTLPENTLGQCFEKNKDGAGFAFDVNGEIVSEKGYFDFEPFYDTVQQFTEFEGIVHCRIATYGPVSKFFCHPFPVKGGYLFHNGSIPTLGSKANSDTYTLSLMLKFMSPKARHSELTKLSKNNRNRFALITKKGGIQFYGKWFEKDGLWFSNLHWEKNKKYTPQTNCWKCGAKNLKAKWMCPSCGTLLYQF